MEKEIGMNNEEINVDEIENFVNNNMIVNADKYSHFITNTHNHSFYAHDLCYLNDVPYDAIEDQALQDIPTTVVLGSLTNPNIWMTLVFYTYDWELEEDEPIHDFVEKLKKNLYRVKHIVKDMDFCMISYPALASTWDDPESIDSPIYKYGLETVIFNTEGFIGGALSKRRSIEEDTEGRASGVSIQYLVPGSHKNIPFNKVRKSIKPGGNYEPILFSKVFQQWYDTPSFASEESLNLLVDDLKRNKIKVLTTRESIQEELQDKVVSLPIDGFVLQEDKPKNKKEIHELLQAILADANYDEKTLSDVMDFYFTDEEE